MCGGYTAVCHSFRNQWVPVLKMEVESAVSKSYLPGGVEWKYWRMGAAIVEPMTCELEMVNARRWMLVCSQRGEGNASLQPI